MKAEPSILFPPFRLDPSNAQLWQGSHGLVLRPKSFAVLQYLLAHPGRLVTKEELLSAVWPNTYVSDALVKDSIVEVRNEVRNSFLARICYSLDSCMGLAHLCPAAL